MPLGDGKVSAFERRALLWVIGAVMTLFTGNGTLTEVIHGKRVDSVKGLTASQVVSLVETMVEPTGDQEHSDVLPLIEAMGKPWLEATPEQRDRALKALGRSESDYTLIYDLHSKMFPPKE